MTYSPSTDVTLNIPVNNRVVVEQKVVMKYNTMKLNSDIRFICSSTEKQLKSFELLVESQKI